MTSEQAEIVRLLNRVVPDRNAARRALEGVEGASRELWKRLVEVGVAGIAFPESWNGGGFGLAEEAIAAETLGYMAAPGPFISAFLAAPVLRASHSAVGQALAERLMSGDSTIGVCLSAEQGLPTHVGVDDSRQPNGVGKLSGEISDALGVDELEIFLLPAGGRWWAVEATATGVERQEVRSLDAGRKLSVVRFASAAGTPVSELAPEAILPLAWTLISAEAVGLAQAALDMARQYALERHQFGQPIGRFQAIKHKLTDALIAVENARSSVHGAVRSARQDLPDMQAARIAKAVATGAAVKVIAEAIQIHGAMGNTWDLDLHLLYRRAKTCELALGAPDEHYEALGAQLVGSPAAKTRGSATEIMGEVRLEDVDREFIGQFRSWLDANVTPEIMASVRARDPVERRKALRAWQARMADAGWVGIHWPKEFNGRAATFTQQVLYHTEIAVRNLPRLIGNRGLSQIGPTLIVHGSPAQRATYVEATRRADILWSSGFSERNAGSDLASLRTRGVIDGDELVINGHKIWTTSAHFADFLYVLVRTGALVPKHAGITCVIVPANSRGLTIRPIRRITGIADFNECFFDDVRVPLSNIVGAVNEGWRVMRTTLSHEHMTNFLGVQFKQAVTVDLVADRLRKREDSGVVSHALRRRLAQAWVNTQLLRLHGMRNVVQLAAGRQPGPEGSILKVFGQEEEKRLWELAVDVVGPKGLVVDKWTTGFLSSRGSTVGGGTSEIHRNKIAERVLGMPRDLWADEGDSAESVASNDA